LSKLYGGAAITSTNPLVVHTDGSCRTTGRHVSYAGAGIYFGHRNALNRSERVLGPQTNNRAELYAVLTALQLAPLDRSLYLYTDSQYVINSLTHWAPMHAKCGWKCTNGDVMKSIVAWIGARSAPLHFFWVKGHSGNKHNDEADRLANTG
ncbi:ribonuclease H-like protein, partial [Dendrothele bispora CBS 962.96]